MKNIKSKPIYNLILSALFSSITVVCAWITVPFTIPFTLQTLAVFLLALLLDTKYGLLSILLYISMGIIGLPVFSGFQGGIGVLLSPTGGFIIGFIFIPVIVGIFRKTFKETTSMNIIPLIIGLLLCYFIGTVWFMFVSKTNFISAITICVLPYIIFDIAKLTLAVMISKRLKIFLKN